jgi:HEAT repeat protein
MIKSPDPHAPVPELLGQLVQMVRIAPNREKEIRRLLGMVSSRVAANPALIEAGIENNWALDGDPLKERLQARQVDAITIAADAPEQEVMALAQALADDVTPIPNTAAVQVRLVTAEPLPIVPASPRQGLSDPHMSMVPRARVGDELAQVIEGILRELAGAIKRSQWHEVLHDAQAAIRMLPGLSDDTRRVYTIALKRLLSREVIEPLIEQAYRVPEEQARTAEVLRAGGLPAAEIMLEALRTSETVGPRAFLVEALGGMPEALPVVAPLARSERSGEARLAAELLGRLGVPEAVPVLVGMARHQDERVRLAVIDALGRYRDKAVVEPLREALTRGSAAVRARAGRALAARGSGAIAMPLLAALEAERDQAAWEELLDALVAIDAPEAVAALTRIALQRPGLFGGGQAQKRQLAVVRALAGAKTAAATQALQRIAAEGDGDVRRAAEEALIR